MAVHYGIMKVTFQWKQAGPVIDLCGPQSSPLYLSFPALRSRSNNKSSARSREGFVSATENLLFIVDVMHMVSIFMGIGKWF